MTADSKELILKLHKACKEGNVTDLQCLVKNDDIQNAVNRRYGKDKKAALHIASENGHEKCVDILLKVPGISVDLSDGRKWTSLQIASDAGNINVVKLLLDKKADVHYTTDIGNTACHYSAMHGYVEVITLLLRAEPTLIDKQNSHKWTSLHLASVDNHADTVRLLLECGANTEITTCHGETAVNLAARNNCIEILRLLKRYGADLDTTNDNGETPFITASICGHEETVAFLLQNNVNVSQTTTSGLNALHFAAKNGKENIIALLRDNAKDFDDMINATSGKANTLWVSKMGCGLNLPSVTPLHLSVIEANFEAAKSLIDAGANKSAADGNGRTPLALQQFYFEKYQVWDREAACETKNILENDNCNDEASALKSYDSDYQSSCTSEDLTENISDLEENIKSLTAVKSANKTRRGLARLKKEQGQVNSMIKHSDNISSVEKDDLNRRLQNIEEQIQVLIKSLDRQRLHSVDEGYEEAAPAAKKPEREKQIKQFRANFTKFQELEAEQHVHFLFQEEVLEPSEVEQILNESTDKKKTMKMLYILYGKKDPKWIDAFIKALENCESAKHLVSFLK